MELRLVPLTEWQYLCKRFVGEIGEPLVGKRSLSQYILENVCYKTFLRKLVSAFQWQEMWERFGGTA